ncbi:MAG: OmpP1/FadL family transporter [Bacteroidales bacterium]
MRKLTLIFVLAVFLSASSYSGGLITNTNQSAAWVRLLVRDASLGIDAVYYNPAGLGYLSNGFHLSLNNQFITQNKDVTNNFTLLNQNKYHGAVSAPLFPGIYAAYKMDKLVFSLGFNPVGGGGGATYEDGVPMFAMPISELVPLMSGLGVTDYSYDVFFEGTSVFFGAQLGVTYSISDMISVYAGARYVFANNTYNGYLRDIAVIAGGEAIAPGTLLTNTASTLYATAESLQPIIDGGYGGLTLEEAEGYGIIDSDTRAQLEAGATSIGMDPSTATINVLQAGFDTAGDETSAQAAAVTAATADQEVDAKQTGSGIAPILGVHFRPSEMFDLAIKYEFKTSMTLTNETTVDGTGMFPDGEEIASDMPAMLSVGANFRPVSGLTVSGGLHYYFDKAADYGRTYGGVPVANDEIIDKNYWEAGLGVEYMFSDKFGASVGFLRAQTGVNEKYQSDLTYSLTSNTLGGGIVYSLNERISLNLGAGYAMYETQTLDYTHDVLGDYTTTYYKDALFIGVGLDFSF